MKSTVLHIISLLLSCTIAHSAMAQSPKPKKDIVTNEPVGVDSVIYTGTSEIDTNEVFLFVDEEPIFNGDMRTFLAENYNFNDTILKTARGGNLFVSFIIERNGSVSDVKIIPGKGLSPEQNAEAIRLIKLTSGMWAPGKINGFPVRCVCKQMFSFSE